MVLSAHKVPLPPGSAFNLAGDLSLLKGNLEFTSFTHEGEIDRNVFSYNSAGTSSSKPIQVCRYIVRVRNSASFRNCARL